MNYNYSKLLGRMREFGFTQDDVANHIGINATTLSLKLNNKSYFSAPEIDAICKVLYISKHEIGEYFFAV